MKYLTLLSLLPVSVLAVDPATLIKVTPENNPSCVTYYTYKNSTYCSTEKTAVTPIDPAIKKQEKQVIRFDNRPWQTAWGKETAASLTIEYVPAGEDINAWNELITSQEFKNLPIGADEFGALIVNKIKSTGLKAEITFIESSAQQTIFEFKISQPLQMQQDEIVKVTKKNDHIYVLHYVIKKADMGQANRDSWIANLKASTIK